ncbi:MAG: hypothetical protein KC925_00250 [Candidatus Doudnabacteria bacterium]|nr:hypothetical protein [Candidatus Doudnabacteria bacterium]MCA9387525.1 hypothetical protein [Candidatus Andersenbacteria bacterium]
MNFEVGPYTIDLGLEGLGSQLGQSAAGSYLDFFEIYGFLLRSLWPLWIAIALVLLYIVFFMYQQNKFAASIEKDLIAITVPPENDKTPKAMEQVMTALWTNESGPNFVEKWFQGEFQLSWSFEIVGINGFVRFLIRTPKKIRPTFDAHIYAQYPDAEIQEVEDYTLFAPKKFPDETWKVYGADITFTKPDAYPIRTYAHFENRLGEAEYNYIDPIGAFVETLGALGEGEQIWFQIIVAPDPSGKMRKEGLALVDEMMKRSKAKYDDIVGRFLTGALHTGVDTLGAMAGAPLPEGGDSADDGDDLPMLSPGEREVLKAVEENIGKLAYVVKMRGVYIAKHEVFQKVNFGNAVGGLMLVNTEHLNGLKLDRKTKAKRDYAKWKIPRLQQKLVTNYRYRDMGAGSNPVRMSTDELATLFHFPYRTTTAPSLERSATRSAQPPQDLPIER